MKRPKPKVVCKQCKNPIKKGRKHATSGVPAKVCSVNCAFKLKYSKTVAKLENKLNLCKNTETKLVKLCINAQRINTPGGLSKSQIKRLTTQTEDLIKKPLNKEDFDRDDNYLTFVRTLPCIVDSCTVKPIHAHHVERGGMGIKGSDYSVVALCHEHHTSGSDAIHNLGVSEFEKTHAIDLVVEQLYTIRQYVRLLKYAKVSLSSI